MADLNPVLNDYTLEVYNKSLEQLKQGSPLKDLVNDLGSVLQTMDIPIDMTFNYKEGPR